MRHKIEQSLFFHTQINQTVSQRSLRITAIASMQPKAATQLTLLTKLNTTHVIQAFQATQCKKPEQPCSLFSHVRVLPHPYSFVY